MGFFKGVAGGLNQANVGGGIAANILKTKQERENLNKILMQQAMTSGDPGMFTEASQGVPGMTPTLAESIMPSVARTGLRNVPTASFADPSTLQQMWDTEKSMREQFGDEAYEDYEPELAGRVAEYRRGMEGQDLENDEKRARLDKYDIEYEKAMIELERLRDTDPDGLWDWDSLNLMFTNVKGLSKFPKNRDAILAERVAVEAAKNAGGGRMPAGIQMEIAKVNSILGAAEGVEALLTPENFAEFEKYIGNNLGAMLERATGTMGGPNLLTEYFGWAGFEEIPENYRKFIFQTAHLKDYLARKRSGAALNTAEQELYAMLTGKASYGRETLLTAMQTLKVNLNKDLGYLSGEGVRPEWWHEGMTVTMPDDVDYGTVPSEDMWDSWSGAQQRYWQEMHDPGGKREY